MVFTGLTLEDYLNKFDEVYGNNELENIISREEQVPQDSPYQELIDLFSIDNRQDSETGYYVDTVINRWLDSNGAFYWDEIAEEYLTQKALYEKMKTSMNEDITKKIMGQVLTTEQIQTLEW